MQNGASQAVRAPCSFPEHPTLEKVIGALNDAIEWHQGCEVRYAYGSYTMIVDAMLRISMPDLSEDMFDLCGLLRKLCYEALRRRG